jgi:hypothetical protein
MLQSQKWKEPEQQEHRVIQWPKNGEVRDPISQTNLSTQLGVRGREVREVEQKKWGFQGFLDEDER